MKVNVFKKLGKWRWPAIGATVFVAVILVTLIVKSAAGPDIALSEAQYGEFVIDLKENGELYAVKSVAVSVPRHVRGNLRVVALAEDGTMVEKGDFLVQFDTSEAMQEVEERKSRLENALADFKSLEANIKSTMAQLKTAFETKQYS